MNSEEYNKLERNRMNGIEKKLEELQNEANKRRFNIENIRKNYPWIGKDLNPSFSNGTVLY
jgi:archaellum component FlaC